MKKFDFTNNSGIPEKASALNSQQSQSNNALHLDFSQRKEEKKGGVEYPVFEYSPGKAQEMEMMKIRNSIKDDILTLYEKCTRNKFEGEISIRGKLIIANERKEKYNEVIQQELEKVPNGKNVITYKWESYSPSFSFIQYTYSNK